MTIKITQDVPTTRSINGKPILYAKAGTEATLITDCHNPVLICRDKSGQSFPVHIDKTDYKK